MTLFCIPKNYVSKLKESALKGKVDIEKLYNMSSKQRRDFFAEYTDTNIGKLLNVEFEKAMVSKQETAMLDWAKSVFTPEAKLKPVYKNIIDKINALDELGVLTPASEKVFLEDLVADKLGINVSPEEVAIINEKAQAIDSAQKKIGEDLGNPLRLKENMDFFKAKKDMDSYLESLSPTNRLKIATGTIGRAAMLASVKSPFLNIVSNIEVGFTEALARRIAGGQLKGTNNKLAVDYMKMVNKIYQATGYDMSRMMTLNDRGTSGSRVMGDVVHSEGQGAIRRIGRFAEDMVFKQLMGAPDVAFGSAHFADSVNMNAYKMADGDITKATEIMTDAMRMVPQTPEGEILRAQGIMDAQKATWTNTTWASKVSEGIRGILNTVSGDLRAGDYLLPFIKTPANVIATGMEYAGGGAVGALVKTVKAIHAGNFGSKEHMNSIMSGLIRSGLGLTAASIIALGLDDDDFVGAYDPKRQQIEALRNSKENSFRVGGKWYSTDWLGPLSVTVSAIMYARKYGSTGAENTFMYSKSVISSASQIPGIKDLADFFKSRDRNKNENLGEMTQSAFDYISSEIYSRIVPSILADVAKGTDSNERKTGRGFTSIQAKIPVWREQLPMKRNIFGEELKTESFLSTIFFGSRVKTDKETATVKEISDVQNNTGASFSFTDWDKSSSLTLAQFKEKKGEEIYDEAKIKYGETLKGLVEDRINDRDYMKMSDDDKLKELNKLDAAAINKIFSKYHFTYKKDKVLSQSSKDNGKRDLVDLVNDYKEAYDVDLVNAFKAMFTSEKLGDVEGNLVQLERFKGTGYDQPGGSEEVIKMMLQKAGIPYEDRKLYNLEHIVPVTAGGDTSMENLYPEKRSIHESYTPIDTLSGKLMKAGKITRSEVTEIMKKLKVEKSITVKEAKDLLDKYN